MTGILQIAKDHLTKTANPHGVYVDFTMGKGRDTLFLCSLAPKGQIYAFDIQPAAIVATRGLLEEQGLENATLILDSHDNFAQYVKEPIDGGLFNLGFLPGGDRTLTTRRVSTIPAVLGAMEALKVGGALGIAVYPGHEEGRLEGEALQQQFASVPKEKFDVFLYRLINIPDAPFMMVIERKG